MNSEKLVNGSLIQYMSFYTRALGNSRQSMSIYRTPLSKHDVGRDGMLLVVEVISVDKQCPWIQEVIKGNVLQNSKSLNTEDFIQHHWMSTTKRITLVGLKYNKGKTAEINLGQVKYIRKI